MIVAFRLPTNALTEIVPLLTPKLSPVYDVANAMVPSDPPEPSKTVRTLPVPSSETLAALATAMPSPPRKLLMTAWKFASVVAVRSSKPAGLSEPSNITDGAIEFVPTALSNFNLSPVAFPIWKTLAAVASTARVNSNMPPLTTIVLTVETSTATEP